MGWRWRGCSRRCSRSSARSRGGRPSPPRRYRAPVDVAGGMARLGTEGAFAVLARARALEATGRDIVHLEIGQPDFDTPAHVKAAAEEALAAGMTGYCPAAGLPELRSAAAEHLAATRGISVDAD